MTDLKKLYEHFSIIPLNGKVPILKGWTKYSIDKISYDDIKNHDGDFGVVCGYGGLEVIDIDNHFDDAKQLGDFILDNYDLKNFLIIKTGGGGYHIYYKCEEIEGNQKLASRINKKGKSETLIETRGQGGQVVFYDNIRQGSIDKIKIISKQERSDLLNICRSLNEVETKTNKTNENKKVNGELPGDRYNNDPLAIEETKTLLTNNRWQTKDELHWIRPDKTTKGISATFGKVGDNKFYVFSSNASPFEPDKSYTMMGVRAELLHNGNYSECAKELAKKYNIKPESKEVLEKKTKNTRWSILEQIIKEWKLEFRYNELTTVIDVSKNNSEYSKLGLMANDIVMEMEMNRGIKTISVAKIKEMIGTSKTCKIYNPIKDFFETIPKWDGVDYITELEKYIELDTDEKKEFFFPMLKKHLIRTLKCALVDKYINRMVFVLYGPQEIGKSMFFRWLSPNDLYNEEPVTPGDKDSILSLARYVMINMDELDSLNKKDVAKLKAFISRGEITKRVPYGHSDERFSRIASFVGSTNKTDILADEKNTRWIILKIKNFDWKGYVKNINPLQIWAQCLNELNKNTDSGELTNAEKTERDVRNDTEFLVTSSEREILMKYFKTGTIPVTATDMKHTIENKLYPLKMNFFQLLRELKRQFGEPSKPKKENGKQGRYYYMESGLFDSSPTPGFYHEPSEKMPENIQQTEIFDVTDKHYNDNLPF